MTMRELCRLFKEAGWTKQQRRDWIEWRENLKRAAKEVSSGQNR